MFSPNDYKIAKRSLKNNIRKAIKLDSNTNSIQAIIDYLFNQISSQNQESRQTLIILQQLNQRSLWYSITLLSLSFLVHLDQLIVINLIEKLISSIIKNLYTLYITRFHIVYKQLTDRLEIEERVDLINNLRMISKSRN